VFHVEHRFFPAWQRLQQLLRQRNAALKSQLAVDEIALWDKQLIPIANDIDQHRLQYVDQLHPIFNELLQQLLPNVSLKLRYYRGWSAEKEIEAVLASAFNKDLQFGYTQFGPQRADLQLYTEKNVPAHDVLSQGQQKLASYAIHLAQGLLLQETMAVSPIYLIDDLPSDLDPDKRQLISEILNTLQSQIFITGTTLQDLKDLVILKNSCVFHVEHGEIRCDDTSTQRFLERVACD